MKKKIFTLNILLVMFVSANLFAFQFSPLTQEFDPSGAGSAKTLRVFNIPIQKAAKPIKNR